MELTSGTLLERGKYRIISVLGCGGFGITYLAEQVLARRKVCIKEFFPKDYYRRNEGLDSISLFSTSNAEVMDKFKVKFIKEAQTIAALDHPNIIHIFDVFEENQTAYYVMEYVDGGQLSDVVKRHGALDEATAVAYIRQVAEALNYIHERKIMHLDVKPGNIMLSSIDGRAVLIDFGLSKHYDDKSGEATSTTPVGVSHGFAPMEQYTTGGVKAFSPATDIYSLGATLYYLVTGSIPPEAAVVGDEGLPALPNHLSQALCAAIERSMAEKRKSRPQSIAEFLALLKDTAVMPTPTLEGAVALPNKPDVSESTTIESPIPVCESTKDAEATAVSVDPIVEAKPTKIETKQPSQSASQTKPKSSSKLWLILIIIIVVAVAIFIYLNGGSSKNSNKTQTPDKNNTPYSPDSKPNFEQIGDYDELISGSCDVIVVEEATTSSIEIAEYEEAIDKARTELQWSTVDKAESKPARQMDTRVDEDDFFDLNATKSTAKNESTTKVETPYIESISGTINGHDYVDLGLSVKWATCNVGATIPEDYGNYYQWGATTPYGDYAQVQFNISCNKQYDAATANWGELWSMPTTADFNELIDNCTWTFSKHNGVKGYMGKSKKNGNCIFFPAAGWESLHRYGVGSSTCYWSGNTPHNDRRAFYMHSLGAFLMDFGAPDDFLRNEFERSRGLPVRPVTPGEPMPEKQDYSVNPAFGVSFKMIWVEGGAFEMCDIGASNKHSKYQVTLDGYWIAETEVTQALWTAVMGKGNRWSTYYDNEDNYPAYYVSYEEAIDFCNTLNEITRNRYNFTLPTEAQWEYAARGGVKSEGYQYSGSNTADDVAWYSKNSDSKMHRVKSDDKSPNELGLYDMSGNVWEWCLDWYKKYPNGSETNPSGPDSGTDRVLRGGSWRGGASNCQVTNRSCEDPDSKTDNIGFRLVALPR